MRWAKWLPWAFYAVLVLAAFVRLWGIDFGLPYDGVTYDGLTIEEIQEVHRALKLGAGEYTWVFGKGGLYLILFAEYGVYFAISWVLGWISGPREFAVQALQDPTTLYVIGRVTVALMGVATCYVIHRIARSIYDERVALGAALIGALAYFHALFSAVINVDIGCTLFLWASLFAYLKYEESGRMTFLVGAGALGAVSVAFKFPGAVILPMLWVAILTSPRTSLRRPQWVKECVIVFIVLLATMTVIAPEWIPRIGWMIHYNFPWLLDAPHAVSVEGGEDIVGEIRSITVLQEGSRLRYLEHLVRNYNVVLLGFAFIAMVAGVMRKSRWDLILTGLLIVFIGIMSLSSRTQPERYLLPIMPALWLLGCRGAFIVASRRAPVAIACITLIVAIPAFSLSRAVVEKSHLDTRILAKDWIEDNVPSGARILMDGMQYRFSQSPPLNPDKASVSQKVQRASREGANLGRGVSDLALSVYREAKDRAKGPTYELASTVHGLKVEPLSSYAEKCFAYIITSSMIADRFAPGGRARMDFPQSAAFYGSLSADRRVQLVHEEMPSAWGNSGPTIRVYRLANECGKTIDRNAS